MPSLLVAYAVLADDIGSKGQYQAVDAVVRLAVDVVGSAAQHYYPLAVPVGPLDDLLSPFDDLLVVAVQFLECMLNRLCDRTFRYTEGLGDAPC